MPSDPPTTVAPTTEGPTGNASSRGLYMDDFFDNNVELG